MGTTQRAVSWLSLGFEDFATTIDTRGTAKKPIDVLIIGSGYGGAIAAAELAGTMSKEGTPLDVCVLERGQEYLPGSFPNAADELATHVRFSTTGAAAAAGRMEGLFDIRLGPDLNAIVANGLGGGSLINAGVMLEPHKGVLDNGFPAAIGGATGLALHYARAGALLGTREYTAASAPAKARALEGFKSVHPHRFIPITVGPLPGGYTSGNVKLEACIECGDCATGCNYGAKNSLDLNLLASAAHKGARIYTGATVLRFEQAKDGAWIVHAVPTDRPLRERFGEPLKVVARRLILAAGTFGSTELMLRSRTEKLRFSNRLGRSFSSNGDMITVLYKHEAIANAVADESVPPANRHVGPTITSMIDMRGDPEQPFAVQEIAVPGAMRRLFEEIFTTSHSLHQLSKADAEPHRCGAPDHDPCAVDPDAISRSTILAIMGDDKAEGTLELDAAVDGDGAVRVRWPTLRSGPLGKVNGSLFDKQTEAMERLVGERAMVLPNPAWRLLPSSLSFLMDEVRGPPLTVHPLGGCGMAESCSRGVVNHLGQVFDDSDPERTRVFENLVILDGSIIPRALGINPALTISALALRASGELRTLWGLQAATHDEPPQRTRPIFRKREHVAKPEAEFVIAERLRGVAAIAWLGSQREMMVELTIHYKKTRLAPLMGAMARVVEVDPDPKKSYVRVYDAASYRAVLGADARPLLRQERLAALPHFRAKLRGDLAFLHREDSNSMQRRLRALWGWFWNRGLRDSVHAIYLRFTERGAQRSADDTVCQRLKGLWNLASRAGEVRRFDYCLKAYDWERRTGEATVPEALGEIDIAGHKRLTYGLRANLWQQLEDLTLTRFGANADARGLGTLGIDLEYFGEAKTPLLRIATQTNLPMAMIDIASFGAYLLRLMVTIHIWSFRRPDSPKPRTPDRLPGSIRRSILGGILRLSPGRPRITELDLGKLPNGLPIRVRLTRYANFASRRSPVLLIHGYSASGTTFAHSAIRPNLTETLWRAGRDVWVIDMRTSSGMWTAIHPWSFEDAALVDIPLAIDHIRRETGSEKVDVVAHCMGAAMFSMAVLKEPEPGEPLYQERMELPWRIGRVVLSQVGPVIQFSPINTLRAYVLRYVRHYLGVTAFDFRISDSPSLAEQLVDRLLSSLRYPIEELRIENPLNFWNRTEFVGTRHRIDALYGRAFSLSNMTPRALRLIDDFFGPLHLETVSQAMHLAQQNVITDRKGRNVYLNRATRDKRWFFPTLSLHGADNGLVDVATRDRIHDYFNRDDRTKEDLPNPRIEQAVIEGAGHQDSLIGKPSVTGPIFRRIVEFLDRKTTSGSGASLGWLVAPPWIGPHRGMRAAGSRIVRLAVASHPKFGNAKFAACVTVRMQGDRYVPVQLSPPGFSAAGHTYLFAADCDQDGWLNVDLPAVLQLSPAEGVLVYLLYDQPRSMTETAAVAAFSALLKAVNEAGEPVPSSWLVAPPAPPSVARLGVAIPFPAIPAILALINVIQSMPSFVAIHEQVDEALKGISASAERAAFVPNPSPSSSATDSCSARLVVGSCQYPAGLLDAQPAWESYRQLGQLVRYELAPLPDSDKLLLLLGDQIYSDATAGIFDPAIKDDRYRRTHETLFSHEDVKAVLRAIPVAMMLDDHEISDNWEPRGHPNAARATSADGIRAYKDFQRRAGPVFVAAEGDAPDPLWFTQNVGGAPLFVADTRTERSPRLPHWKTPTIMSERQMGALKQWLEALAEDPATMTAPKFVASPSMLLPRRLATQRKLMLGTAGAPTAGWHRSDAWDGFPASFATIMAFVAERRIENVVFLSGDEHLFCKTGIDLRSKGSSAGVRAWSIHCSPLYAPFPFANAAADDFADRERFEFQEAATGSPVYECSVETSFYAAQNGFAELLADRNQGQWTASVRIHDTQRGPGPWERLF